MKKLILSAVATAVFSTTALAAIQYSSDVPNDQKKLLTKDMFFLANQSYPTDPKLSQMLGLTANDGLTILNWVDNRMNRIVSEKFDFGKNVFVVNQAYTPPVPENPVIPSVVKTPGKNNGGSGPKVMTIMSNMGGAIYVSGKLENKLLGINIDGERVDVTSPRIGIFKVGEGLFNSRAMLGSSAGTIISRYFRLSTLIHEARHSDGRGVSAAFLHTVCPKGHRLEGYAGCDANSNGPYSIEGQFLKVAIRSCVDCQPSELEFINKMVADSFGRVVTPENNQQDDVNAQIISAYELALGLCRRLPGTCTPEQISNYQNAIARARLAATPATQAPVWDATPEGTFPATSRDQTWTRIYQLNQQFK